MIAKEKSKHLKSLNICETQITITAEDGEL